MNTLHNEYIMNDSHDERKLQLEMTPFKTKIRVDWTTAEIIHALAITALRSVAKEILRPHASFHLSEICQLECTNGLHSSGGFSKLTQVQNID